MSESNTLCSPCGCVCQCTDYITIPVCVSTPVLSHVRMLVTGSVSFSLVVCLTSTLSNYSTYRAFRLLSPHLIPCGLLFFYFCPKATFVLHFPFTVSHFLFLSLSLCTLLSSSAYILHYVHYSTEYNVCVILFEWPQNIQSIFRWLKWYFWGICLVYECKTLIFAYKKMKLQIPAWQRK